MQSFKRIQNQQQSSDILSVSLSLTEIRTVKMFSCPAHACLLNYNKYKCKCPSFNSSFIHNWAYSWCEHDVELSYAVKSLKYILLGTIHLFNAPLHTYNCLLLQIIITQNSASQTCLLILSLSHSRMRRLEQLILSMQEVFLFHSHPYPQQASVSWYIPNTPHWSSFSSP